MIDCVNRWPSTINIIFIRGIHILFYFKKSVPVKSPWYVVYVVGRLLSCYNLDTVRGAGLMYKVTITRCVSHQPHPC